MSQLKNVRVLATCGIMAALAVALKFVASIDIGNYIRIGFSDLPGIVISYLFGPWIGAIFWGVLDIIKFFMAPNGPFFPGFTLTQIVSGIIYGLILYKKPLSWVRVGVAVLIVRIVANLVLNTIWVIVLYGYGLWAILPTRLITNAIMVPIDTVMVYFLLRLVRTLWCRIMPESQSI